MLSPLGRVSVCPGGQVLLTCERTSGSFLIWTVSSPHPMATTHRRLVANQGRFLSTVFRIGFTEFNITRTSESPLISQLMINNVTTEINGSTIYCSQDGDENNAPMTVMNVINKGMILRLIKAWIRLWLFHITNRSDSLILIVFSMLLW